ncbi:hypothetical protein S7711_04379 [Stachybotrys chartarum IBT 7711]|uniref:Steroid 5-alpha reductase C-terminal domain-containing protein n=1 Tax=Stachybotrys chartarum (strain CBS 109288 / IBT 7711) TaxID=1280523 RepID=A0A084AY92_STACB|nr:hypothetical protein S7711_04379 [Stachybotrys chartarum IBT 7711]KFA55766.1 hypothetical protein S40293_01959 [Stachybotrys chartarum IBT 40293]
MAVPHLKSIKGSADYSVTLEPYIPQLYELPSRLLQVRSLRDLEDVYVETNPLISGLSASIALGFIVLVVSEINRNYSQVDRLWSIVPTLYLIHMAAWAHLNDLPHSRLDLIALFGVIWSVSGTLRRWAFVKAWLIFASIQARLTYNYWRKGGYNVGSEDYRWEIVKKRVPGLAWFIFNVTFISFYQSILLFSFSAVPAYVILLSTQFEPEITTADMLYFSIQVALVASEWVSDGQQWTYQTAKHQYYKDARVPEGFAQDDLDRGFLTSGLWAYSRHPNFFAEQSIWFVLYQWACFASNTLYNWSGIGAAALILLFQGSTWLTEAITTGKYAEYKEYQKQVGMFIPKSLKPYQTPKRQPTVIRTSELAKRAQLKEKQKQK